MLEYIFVITSQPAMVGVVGLSIRLAWERLSVQILTATDLSH